MQVAHPPGLPPRTKEIMIPACLTGHDTEEPNLDWYLERGVSIPNAFRLIIEYRTAYEEARKTVEERLFKYLERGVLLHELHWTIEMDLDFNRVSVTSTVAVTYYPNRAKVKTIVHEGPPLPGEWNGMPDHPPTA